MGLILCWGYDLFIQSSHVQLGCRGKEVPCTKKRGWKRKELTAARRFSGTGERHEATDTSLEGIYKRTSVPSSIDPCNRCPYWDKSLFLLRCCLFYGDILLPHYSLFLGVYLGGQGAESPSWVQHHYPPPPQPRVALLTAINTGVGASSLGVGPRAANPPGPSVYSLPCVFF